MHIFLASRVLGKTSPHHDGTPGQTQNLRDLPEAMPGKTAPGSPGQPSRSSQAFSERVFSNQVQSLNPRFARVGRALREVLFTMGGSSEALTISLASPKRLSLRLRPPYPPISDRKPFMPNRGATSHRAKFVHPNQTPHKAKPAHFGPNSSQGEASRQGGGRVRMR